MGVVTMRSLTASVFQRWHAAVRPGDDFDYSAGLLQFVLSNNLVDVALVGMRNRDEVDQNLAVLRNLEGRMSLEDIHEKYV